MIKAKRISNNKNNNNNNFPAGINIINFDIIFSAQVNTIQIVVVVVVDVTIINFFIIIAVEVVVVVVVANISVIGANNNKTRREVS